MYVILVGDDNTLSAPKKSRIMHKSNLIDKFWFIVNQNYNGYDMSNFTATLEYVSPVSKKHYTENLKLQQEKCEEFLKYLLPIDTSFTDEIGKVKLNLTFSQLDIDENGKQFEHIRKTEDILVEINPISTLYDNECFDGYGFVAITNEDIDAMFSV